MEEIITTIIEFMEHVEVRCIAHKRLQKNQKSTIQGEPASANRCHGKYEQSAWTNKNN